MRAAGPLRPPRLQRRRRDAARGRRPDRRRGSRSRPIPRCRRSDQIKVDRRRPEAHRRAALDRRLRARRRGRHGLHDRSHGRRGARRVRPALVLGLRLSSDEAASKTILEAPDHPPARQQGGYGLVPQGTPTNNTERARRRHSWVNDPDASYDSVIKGKDAYAESDDPLQRRDGQWLAEAFGIDRRGDEARARTRAHTDQAEARAMNIALWTGHLGYMLEEMMAPVFYARRHRRDAAVLHPLRPRPRPAAGDPRRQPALRHPAGDSPSRAIASATRGPLDVPTLPAAPAYPAVAARRRLARHGRQRRPCRAGRARSAPDPARRRRPAFRLGRISTSAMPRAFSSSTTSSCSRPARSSARCSRRRLRKTIRRCSPVSAPIPPFIRRSSTNSSTARRICSAARWSTTGRCRRPIRSANTAPTTTTTSIGSRPPRSTSSAGRISAASRRPTPCSISCCATR